MTVNESAQQFFNRVEPILIYLADRWGDYGDTECLLTYLLPLQSHAEECGVELRKMTEDPFGVQFLSGAQLCWAYFQGREYVLQYLREER